MEFYILKRSLSLSLGMNFCRFSYRGQNDQGTKWPGTKWPGTKCMRGRNDRDEMTGYKMKWDEVYCHHFSDIFCLFMFCSSYWFSSFEILNFYFYQVGPDLFPAVPKPISWQNVFYFSKNYFINDRTLLSPQPCPFQTFLPQYVPDTLKMTCVFT
jgi:hypothetical protein